MKLFRATPIFILESALSQYFPFSRTLGARNEFIGKYHIFKICFVNLLKLHQYVQPSHFSFQNNLVNQIIIILKTRITKIKRGLEFNLILNLAYAMKPHATRHISGKYLFETYLMLVPQYSSIPCTKKFCFMAYGKIMKAKAYQCQVVLSSLPTLLIASEACSLAPWMDQDQV